MRDISGYQCNVSEAFRESRRQDALAAEKESQLRAQESVKSSHFGNFILGLGLGFAVWQGAYLVIIRPLVAAKHKREVEKVTAELPVTYKYLEPAYPQPQWGEVLFPMRAAVRDKKTGEKGRVVAIRKLVAYDHPNGSIVLADIYYQLEWEKRKEFADAYYKQSDLEAVK